MLKSISEDMTKLYVDTKLRRSRQSEVLKLVNQVKLNPQDFRWDYVESPVYRQYGGEKPGVSAFIHNPTGSYFIFDTATSQELRVARFTETAEGELNISCELKPGQHREVETTTVEGWEGQRALAHVWLDIVKKEHDTPDVWAAIQQERSVIQATADVENTPFTEEEAFQVQGQLAELKEYIVANVSDPTSDQLDRIETNLDYLSNAVGRLGRRDWLETFKGILLTIMFTVPEVQTAAQDIFHFAMYRIAGILNITVETAQRLFPGNS